MTTGLAWQEDYRTPGGDGQRLLSRLRPAAKVAETSCAVARRRTPRTPAGATAPQTRLLSTGPGNAPRARTTRPLSPSSSRRPLRVRRDRGARPLPRRRLGSRRHGARSHHPRLGPARDAPARRWWPPLARAGCATARLPRSRSCVRAGCPATSPRTRATATTGGRSTTPATWSWPTAAAVSSARRPRPRHRRGQDFALALRRLACRPAEPRPVLPRDARDRPCCCGTGRRLRSAALPDRRALVGESTCALDGVL